MRALSKIQTVVLALLAISACSPNPAPVQPSDAGEKIGAYLGAWLGYLPGQIEKRGDLPKTLSSTESGVATWVTTRQLAIETSKMAVGSTSSALTASGGSLGSVSTTLSSTLSGSGTSGSSTLPASPATGSGALPSAPAAGGGSIPSTPAEASGSLPSTPVLGSGSSVTLDPKAFGTSTGSASSSDVVTALCDYLTGFFSFADRCLTPSNPGTFTAAINSLGGCPTFVSGLLANLPTQTFPASTIKALDCVGMQFKTVACSGTDATTPLKSSFSACGINTTGL